jgi:hypothetical protein
MKGTKAMTTRKVGTREEWLAAREELLPSEKEHTRLGDELARRRRELPWVPVEKEYALQTADGPRTLAELFSAVVVPSLDGGTIGAWFHLNSSVEAVRELRATPAVPTDLARQ